MDVEVLGPEDLPAEALVLDLVLPEELGLRLAGYEGQDEEGREKEENDAACRPERGPSGPSLLDASRHDLGPFPCSGHRGLESLS